MTFGLGELLIALLLFGLIAVAGIFDAALRPDEQWARAEQSKVAWILVQVVLGPPGAIAYFAAVRPKLKTAAA